MSQSKDTTSQFTFGPSSRKKKNRKGWSLDDVDTGDDYRKADVQKKSHVQNKSKSGNVWGNRNDWRGTNDWSGWHWWGQRKHEKKGNNTRAGDKKPNAELDTPHDGTDTVSASIEFVANPVLYDKTPNDKSAADKKKANKNSKKNSKEKKRKDFNQGSVKGISGENIPMRNPFNAAADAAVKDDGASPTLQTVTDQLPAFGYVKGVDVVESIDVGNSVIVENPAGKVQCSDTAKTFNHFQEKSYPTSADGSKTTCPKSEGEKADSKGTEAEQVPVQYVVAEEPPQKLDVHEKVRASRVERSPQKTAKRIQRSPISPRDARNLATAVETIIEHLKSCSNVGTPRTGARTGSHLPSARSPRSSDNAENGLRTFQTPYEIESRRDATNSLIIPSEEMEIPRGTLIHERGSAIVDQIENDLPFPDPVVTKDRETVKDLPFPNPIVFKNGKSPQKDNGDISARDLSEGGGTPKIHHSLCDDLFANREADPLKELVDRQCSNENSSAETILNEEEAKFMFEHGRLDENGRLNGRLEQAQRSSFNSDCGQRNSAQSTIESQRSSQRSCAQSQRRSFADEEARLEHAQRASFESEMRKSYEDENALLEQAQRTSFESEGRDSGGARISAEQKQVVTEPACIYEPMYEPTYEQNAYKVSDSIPIPTPYSSSRLTSVKSPEKNGKTSPQKSGFANRNSSSPGKKAQGRPPLTGVGLPKPKVAIERPSWGFPPPKFENITTSMHQSITRSVTRSGLHSSTPTSLRSTPILQTRFLTTGPITLSTGVQTNGAIKNMAKKLNPHASCNTQYRSIGAVTRKKSSDKNRSFTANASIEPPHVRGTGQRPTRSTENGSVKRSCSPIQRETSPVMTTTQSLKAAVKPRVTVSNPIGVSVGTWMQRAGSPMDVGEMNIGESAFQSVCIPLPKAAAALDDFVGPDHGESANDKKGMVKSSSPLLEEISRELDARMAAFEAKGGGKGGMEVEESKETSSSREKTLGPSATGSNIPAPPKRTSPKKRTLGVFTRTFTSGVHIKPVNNFSKIRQVSLTRFACKGVSESDKDNSEIDSCNKEVTPVDVDAPKETTSKTREPSGGVRRTITRDEAMQLMKENRARLLRAGKLGKVSNFPSRNVSRDVLNRELMTRNLPGRDALKSTTRESSSSNTRELVNARDPSLSISVADKNKAFPCLIKAPTCSVPLPSRTLSGSFRMPFDVVKEKFSATVKKSPPYNTNNGALNEINSALDSHMSGEDGRRNPTPKVSPVDTKQTPSSSFSTDSCDSKLIKSPCAHKSGENQRSGEKEIFSCEKKLNGSGEKKLSITSGDKQISRGEEPLSSGEKPFPFMKNKDSASDSLEESHVVTVEIAQNPTEIREVHCNLQSTPIEMNKVKTIFTPSPIQNSGSDTLSLELMKVTSNSMKATPNSLNKSNPNSNPNSLLKVTTPTSMIRKTATPTGIRPVNITTLQSNTLHKDHNLTRKSSKGGNSAMKDTTATPRPTPKDSAKDSVNHSTPKDSPSADAYRFAYQYIGGLPPPPGLAVRGIYRRPPLLQSLSKGSFSKASVVASTSEQVGSGSQVGSEQASKQVSKSSTQQNVADAQPNFPREVLGGSGSAKLAPKNYLLFPNIGHIGLGIGAASRGQSPAVRQFCASASVGQRVPTVQRFSSGPQQMSNSGNTLGSSANIPNSAERLCSNLSVVSHAKSLTTCRTPAQVVSHANNNTNITLRKNTRPPNLPTAPTSANNSARSRVENLVQTPATVTTIFESTAKTNEADDEKNQEDAFERVRTIDIHKDLEKINLMERLEKSEHNDTVLDEAKERAAIGDAILGGVEGVQHTRTLDLQMEGSSLVVQDPVFNSPKKYSPAKDSSQEASSPKEGECFQRVFCSGDVGKEQSAPSSKKEPTPKKHLLSNLKEPSPPTPSKVRISDIVDTVEAVKGSSPEGSPDISKMMMKKLAGRVWKKNAHSE